MAILEPHITSTLKKNTIKPSRRLVEAITFLFLADGALVRHFNSLHVIDLLGREDLRLSKSEEPLRLKSYKDSLRSYWTTDDGWNRIRSAILEAYQVRATYVTSSTNINGLLTCLSSLALAS